MTSALLALSASIAWGFSSYAGGVASRSLRVPVVLLIAMLAGCAVVVPVVVIKGAPEFQGAEAAWAVAGGVIALGSLGLMYAAMSVGAVSIVGPVSACGVAIPVLVGLALGEQPHTVQLAGIAAAASGVVLASVERDAGDLGPRLVAGLGLALGSAVCVGLWFVSMDQASAHDPYWAAMVGRLVTAVLALLVTILWRPPVAAAAGPAPRTLRAAPRAVLLLVVACGLADAVGELTFAVSTTYGLISIVAVIASLYPAFMVAFAALFLRERLARHQVVGVAAALLGLALMSAG